MGPTCVLSAPDGTHVGFNEPCYQGLYPSRHRYPPGTPRCSAFLSIQSFSQAKVSRNRVFPNIKSYLLDRFNYGCHGKFIFAILGFTISSAGISNTSTAPLGFNIVEKGKHFFGFNTYIAAGFKKNDNSESLVQGSGISIANALEIRQSCTKHSI